MSGAAPHLVFPEIICGVPVSYDVVINTTSSSAEYGNAAQNTGGGGGGVQSVVLLTSSHLMCVCVCVCVLRLVVLRTCFAYYTRRTAVVCRMECSPYYIHLS